MKKQLLWVLTFAVLALFPYQNATADLVQLSRDGWSATASSYDSGESAPASKAIDGVEGTNNYWVSNRSNNYPHWLQINLGSVQEFSAFNYVSRLTGTDANGNILNYKLYVSNSDISGNYASLTPIKEGTFSTSSTQHLIELGQTYSGQYICLVATSATKGSWDGNTFQTSANCSEFYLYKNDYCTPSGNMANSNSRSRKLNSFTLSDGTNSVSVSSIQASYTDAMYKDKTASVLTTTQGATLRFSALDWDGSWMHGYAYIDYNGDKTFNTTANNNGATEGELVSYNYYSGSNILETTTTDGCGVTKENIPSWTLPSDLPVGEYRLRFKIDWNSLDPCGSSEMASNNGCVVDITLNVESSAPSNSRPQDLFTSANISQANNIYPYRIPGITSTSKDGRLIATAARLVCGTDPGYGRVDAVCRISDDNGVTWGPEKTIAAGDGQTSATANYFETAYGDPAVIADRTSNEVIVVVVAGCTVYPNATTNRDNPNMIGIIRSTDNGETWGTPENFTNHIYGLYDNVNTVDAAFVGGGKIFQSRIVKVGNYYRLYAAMCARPNGNRVIYSDDFGRSWKPLGGAAASITPDNGNEPKCEELPDGRVILSSRNSNGNGRLYNIYTYTNTETGEGSWSSCTASSFEGSNHAPGSNNTNGEILIVPVVRKTDSKEMYLVLQSQPTGNDRVNVGIYYKELTDLADMNTVANFATGWNGFYQVSTTESAYSSMDLQDDGKVGFIYEETLTRDGTVQNPTSTNFPTGSGTHNFDGYNNIYRAYTIEQLTNNAYSLKTDVNRGTFVKTYLTNLVDASVLPATTKTNLKADITAMGDEPTTAQVDAIYTVLNADPWDGKVVTFTNIQSNGDQRALYINNSVLSLGTTSQTAESIGASAQFLCTKEASGKYSFKNIATNEYMIYRNQDNPTDATAKGANDNKGTLSTYDATYCDWTLGDGSGTKAGTYYISAGRPSTSSPSSCLIVLSTGLFDGWARHEVAYTATYSNLYEIGIVEVATDELIESAKEIINKTGVGYPKTNSAVRTTLQTAIETAEADASVVNGLALQSAIDSYYASTDVELPTNGVLYSFIVGHTTNKAYIYNNGGTLAVAKYTEGETVLPEIAKFTCIADGEYFVFRTSDGKYIAFPGYQADQYEGSSTDGIEDNITDLTRFSTPKILNGGNVAASSNADLFGNVYLNVKLRGTTKSGDNAGNAINGVFVVKFKNNGTLLDSPVWDGASVPYVNDNFSSAISVVAVGYPLTATASPAEGGTATVSASLVEINGSATFTASANDSYNFIGWYKEGEDAPVSTDLEYLAENINEPLNLTAKYVEQSTMNVTVPSTFGKVTKDGEEVNGSITGNLGATVQLTAVADEGYIFDRWVVKNTSTNEVSLKKGNSLNVVLGTYQVEAFFAPEAYNDVCKPETINKAGNVFVVNSATITNGEGVDDCTIVGTAFNKNSSGVVYRDAELAQWGATKAITIEHGASFTLNIEYAKNWGDVELFIKEGDANFRTLYGPYEGSDAPGLAFTNMEKDNTITTSGNTASFPITISKDLENGDVVVIRSASGSFNGNACPTSIISEGGYLDFVFVVKDIPERTINVNVAPSKSAIITIDGESKTTTTSVKVITIEAQAQEGYVFENWMDVDGNVLSTEATIIDRTGGDKTYTANSVRVWNVTTSSNKPEWGTAHVEGGLGEGVFKNATTATLVATPAQGCKFVQWTLNGKTISTNPTHETVIMTSESYIAEFDKDYPEMKLQYKNTGEIADERRSNRYLKSLTATAGDLSTNVFNAVAEQGLPRVDAEISAFNNRTANLTPTTTGALIDKTGNTIKVLAGTETIDLTFKAWTEPMTVRSYTAEPELHQTQQVVFVDWNNDHDFLDTNEKYEVVDGTDKFNEDAGYTRSISVPATTTIGAYRMRVIYYDVESSSTPAADWASTIFNDCVINQGRAYDFTIEVVNDENYISFVAPGDTYFTVGDVAEITLTYPDADATIYYSVDGTDPDLYAPTMKSGGKIALNTFVDGVTEIKARVGENGTIYRSKYIVVPASSGIAVPQIVKDENASTIIAAEIRNGNGIADGSVNYPFYQGQQVVLDAIPVTSTATFDFDVTFKMNKYAITVWRMDIDDGSGVKSTILTSNAEDVIDMAAYKSFLDGKSNVTSTVLSESDKTLKLTFNVDIDNGMLELEQRNSVIYRVIISSIASENILVTPNQDYEKGEYVDFVFTVAPPEKEIKLYGTEGKNVAVSVTTATDCFISVGGKTQNVTAGEAVPVEAKMNAAGELAIEAVGGDVKSIDIEMLECGTNILLPETDIVKTVKLKSDADFNATTVSYASVLPEDGVLIEVEKEIMLSYDKYANGTKPTYFNFLSMPFDFDAGINIEFFHPTEGVWKQATLEKDIRILVYNSTTRAYGTQYYGTNWQKLSGAEAQIFANQGFVMVGNANYDTGDHKMKVRFKSFYAEQDQSGELAVTREISYKQDGNPKSIKAVRYRNTRGETHPFDADWQHVGSPYLTHSDGFDYILYYHNGYTYEPIPQTDNPTISAYQSVMFQAELGDIVEQNIVVTPLAGSSRTRMAQSVYGKAYLAINDNESVKIILNDEASDNFVINEDAWYLEPTGNSEATMSVNVAGSEASITVQPEPSDMPLTVYTGVMSTQTISLSRLEGDVNVYLKDAVTDEVVCLNDEDYTFEATPKTTIADRFTISMTDPTGIEGNTVSTSDIKVVVDGDNLTIYGAEVGEMITLYTVNGAVLATAEAEDGATTIATSATGVVVVKVGTEALKVVIP